LVSGLRRASVVCAGVGASLAVVLLLGWALDVEIFKRMLPGLPSMKADAAVCFLLPGFSLAVHSHSPRRSGRPRAAGGRAGPVVLVGAATLAEYAFGVRLGIDRLLFGDHAGPGAPYPGRPAALAWPTALLGFWALTGYATGGVVGGAPREPGDRAELGDRAVGPCPWRRVGAPGQRLGGGAR
jgi:hypothetical protein